MPRHNWWPTFLFILSRLMALWGAIAGVLWSRWFSVNKYDIPANIAFKIMVDIFTLALHYKQYDLYRVRCHEHISLDLIWYISGMIVLILCRQKSLHVYLILCCQCLIWLPHDTCIHQQYLISRMHNNHCDLNKDVCFVSSFSLCRKQINFFICWWNFYY